MSNRHSPLASQVHSDDINPDRTIVPITLALQ